MILSNVLQAALTTSGYCLGHGLGLHLLLAISFLPSFQDSIGHKFGLRFSGERSFITAA